MLPQLRAILREDDSPYVELMGNMAAIVERTLCSGLFGKNLGAKEALVLKLARLRDELAGAEPTPIERLLAERGVVLVDRVRIRAAIRQRGPTGDEAGRVPSAADRRGPSPVPVVAQDAGDDPPAGDSGNPGQRRREAGECGESGMRAGGEDAKPGRLGGTCFDCSES